jgi:polyisoprenoid-binding protein YceI
MKNILFILLALGISFSAQAQKFMTKNGYIGFYSHTPMEDIKADNNQVASVIDISSGELVFQALIKSFHFERALMEEHFNENYMESEKYPKATFKGKILNQPSVDLSKEGKYEVTVEGDLNIHNVTNKVSVKAILEVAQGAINASSKFNIIPEDYAITIPGVVREKINKSLEVTVLMKYTAAGSK